MLIIASADNQPIAQSIEHQTFRCLAQVRHGFESHQGGSLYTEEKLAGHNGTPLGMMWLGRQLCDCPNMKLRQLCGCPENRKDRRP